MPVTTIESDDGYEVVLAISGRFDFSCYHEFMQHYQAFPQGQKRYVVDLAATEYLDSSAMGMLLQLREFGDRLAAVSLINAQQEVAEMLSIANFDKLFDIPPPNGAD